jgi:hypothetical protein
VLSGVDKDAGLDHGHRLLEVPQEVSYCLVNSPVDEGHVLLVFRGDQDSDADPVLDGVWDLLGEGRLHCLFGCVP